jgi:uncharacterized membrane protein
MKKELFLLTILLIATIVTAQEYYADLEINITNNGETELKGTTNHELLGAKTTQKYTSKQGEKWFFELNVMDTFSEYIYEIKFPERTEIQKVETLGEYRMTTKEGKTTIIGIGKNEQLKIKIEYTIGETKTNNTNYLILGIVILGIITAGIIIFTLMKRKTKKRKIIYEKDALTERQLKIMEQIEQTKGKITQTELRKKLGYPKAALSRNLRGLEKKGIIEKERKGMTMLVKIKE